MAFYVLMCHRNYSLTHCHISPQCDLKGRSLGFFEESTKQQQQQQEQDDMRSVPDLKPNVKIEVNFGIPCRLFRVFEAQQTRVKIGGGGGCGGRTLPVNEVTPTVNSTQKT